MVIILYKQDGQTYSLWSWTCQACCDISELGVSRKDKFCYDEVSLRPHECLISSLKRTRRTWAGQGGSDSEGEKEVANIFTVYTNH